jgi:uncharacterized protein YodC (DUF2158 family)
MQFRVGDVVQLRYGGGPRMTVEKVTTSNGNTWVTCVWGDSKECHNYFVGEMLQKSGSIIPPVRSSGFVSIWRRLAFWRDRQAS